MTETRPARWPLVVVSLAALAIGAPFLLGGQAVYWGTPLLQFFPWRQIAIETLRGGHLPLWNPLVGNGAPLIANYQSALFYPPNWLMLLAPPDLAMGWLMAAHWLWAGVGMVYLSRALGLKPLGQAVAGLAFGVSQCLVARSGFLSINAAVAWMPWVILAGEQIANPKFQIPNPKLHLRNGLWLTLCVALQLLAGHAQTAWYTLLLLAVWVLWRPLTVHRFPSAVIRHSSFVIAFILLSFALAAVQLLPTAELLRESPRAASAEYEFVMTYSLSPWRLLTFFAPDILGNPARGVFYGYGNFWEDALYIGLLPAIFAFGLLIKKFTHLFHRPLPVEAHSPPSREGRKEGEQNFLRGLSAFAVQPRDFYLSSSNSLILFLSFVFLVTLLLALGRNTPVFPFLYQHMPTFNLFQAPARWLMVTALALALLAGLGADGWQRPRGWGRYWLNLGAAGALMMTLTSAGVWWLTRAADTTQRAQLHTVAQAVLLCGAGLLLSTLLSLLQPSAESRRWQWAVIAFVTLDLFSANYGLNPTAPVEVYRSPSATGANLLAALNGHRLFYFPSDEYATKFSWLSFKNFGPPNVARALRAAQAPNAAVLDGLASANNFEPLVSARYSALLEVISATHSIHLLRLMDVGLVASRAPLDWESVARAEGVTFYRVPLTPQRVWVVYSARPVPDESAALAALAEPNFDPSAEVILESPPRETARLCPTVTTPSPNVATFTVSLTQEGWVVLADTDYPGWEAQVDDAPAAVWRANAAFRAVAVPAGEHTITFCYRPASFEWGWRVSALAALVWLGAWVFSSYGAAK